MFGSAQYFDLLLSVPNFYQQHKFHLVGPLRWTIKTMYLVGVLWQGIALFLILHKQQQGNLTHIISTTWCTINADVI